MPALKVSRFAGTGTIAPSLKVSRFGGTGTAAVLLNAIANQTVEPGVLVTVTAVLSAGGSADSTVFRVVSGDTVTMTTTAGSLTATFISPSVLDSFKAPRQASTVIGVTATVGGVTTPERTMTVTTLPQESWVWGGTGVGWLGRPHRLLP